MKKPLLIIAVAMLLIIVTMGCKKDKAVTGVTLDKSNLTLEVGKTENLTATIQPNDATNKSVSWESSNPVVASVVQGIITAITEGTATITVTTTDGGYTAKCVVTVSFTDPEVGVVINGVRWATRNVDAPGTFVANSQDAGMFYQWNRKIGWRADGPLINSNGGTTWDSSIPSGTTWEKANDPCPSGWRVPTSTELQSLKNAGSRWITVYFVNGRMYGNSDNYVFLPAAGYRWPENGNLLGAGGFGYCWGSDLSGTLASSLHFNSNDNASGTGATIPNTGYSVRCVAE